MCILYRRIGVRTDTKYYRRSCSWSGYAHLTRSWYNIDEMPRGILHTEPCVVSCMWDSPKIWYTEQQIKDRNFDLPIIVHFLQSRDLLSGPIVIGLRWKKASYTGQVKIASAWYTRRHPCAVNYVATKTGIATSPPRLDYWKRDLKYLLVMWSWCTVITIIFLLSFFLLGKARDLGSLRISESQL